MFVSGEPRAEERLLPGQKLRPKVDGPYEVLKVRSHTVKISRDGLLNTVSKDRVIRAPQELTEVVLYGQPFGNDIADDAIPGKDINPHVQNA